MEKARLLHTSQGLNLMWARSMHVLVILELNVTLSDFFPVESDKKKGNNSRNVSPATSRRSWNTSPAMSRRSSVVSLSDSPRDQAVPKSEDAVMEDCTESHQAEINRKIRANYKLRKILTNMPDEHKSLIYGDSLKAKMQSLDDEKVVALLAAKRQFLHLQSRIEKQKNYLERISREIETKQQHRLEILHKWIEADQELDAAHAKQVQAKHEMSILVAEQTAENAKAVNQNTSGIQSLSSGSNPDPDAQQTILSVFKSVLSMQSMGCHSVAEQLMAAGATDEEVRTSVRSWHKQCGNWRVGVLSQNQGSKLSNLRAMWWYWTQRSPRAYLVSAAWTPNAKKPSRGVCRTQPQKRDVWQRNASTRRMSYNMLCLCYWIRFIAVPFYQRKIQVLFAIQRSCLAPNTTQLANGLRMCPARAKWNWNHCSHKLVNADNCLVNVSEKIPSPTRHRSVRTSTALTVIWSDFPCLFHLSVSVTLHTLSNLVIISLFFKKVSRVAEVIVFCRICIFVAWKARSGVTPFVIARPEEDANTLGRNASWRFPKAW